MRGAEIRIAAANTLFVRRLWAHFVTIPVCRGAILLSGSNGDSVGQAHGHGKVAGHAASSVPGPFSAAQKRGLARVARS